MIISYLIGYSAKDYGSGTFTFPYIITAKVFRQFSDMVREEEFIQTVFDYAGNNYVPPSTMVLMININNERYRVIKMKNVREYKVLVDKLIKKNQEQ